MTNRDKLKIYSREMETVAVFDHDAKHPRIGHGALCIRGCKPVDVISGVPLWSDDEGTPVDDPEQVEILEAKLLRDRHEGPRFALVNLARDLFMDAIIGGASYTKFTNAAAAIGVGDSNTAHDPAQTNLQAATNKLRKGMDATFPTRSTNEVTFRSTFGTSEANFAWNERGIFNSTTTGQMLSRKAGIALGTKTSSFAWQITCEDALTI